MVRMRMIPCLFKRSIQLAYGTLQQRCKLCSSTVLPNLLSNDFISNDHLDEQYYLNESNFEEIHQNIKLRQLTELDELLTSCNNNKNKMKEILEKNITRLPNKLNSSWKDSVEIKEKLLKEDGRPQGEESIESRMFKPKTAQKLFKANKLLVAGTEHSLSHASSNQCYAMTGDLVRLEKVLLSWTKDQLVQKFNFIPVVVPNLLYDQVIRACGFEPHGQRTQVYTLKGSNTSRQVCLSGTSEIPLVALNMGQLMDGQSLPKRLCAVSRCYRAEVAGSGLYRVHYFNKVEMVAITGKDESASVLEEFVDIQRQLFSQLGLKYRVRDMPPHDLGLPAFRKFDIEAYFPVSKIWGEISSASNCTDYQSRRFNIQYRHFDPDGEELVRDEYVHTVNGTACASPRILLPLVEGNQEEVGRIRIPEILRERMDGQTYLNKRDTM